MSRQNKRRCGVTTIISGIVLIAVVICIGCKKHPREPTQTKHYPEQAKSEPVTENIGESAKTDTNVPAIATIPKVRLYDVIKAARTWQPVYTSLYRKPAPDFILTDITGKVPFTYMNQEFRVYSDGKAEVRKDDSGWFYNYHGWPSQSY